MQQTLSMYLLTFALMTLFHGTISDSLGHRPVILINLGVFTVASAGCAFAASFEQLLFFRGIQGLSAGSGIVVGRAIIRDTFDGHLAQRLMSLLTMIFGVAPAVAPVIGGWLQAGFGWRSIFVFLGIYSAVLFLTCHLQLPETLPRYERQPLKLIPLARNYCTLGRSLPLFLLSSAIALNFCGFFSTSFQRQHSFTICCIGERPSSRGCLFQPSSVSHSVRFSRADLPADSRRTAPSPSAMQSFSSGLRSISSTARLFQRACRGP
jgi:multidrug resistance protein